MQKLQSTQPRIADSGKVRMGAQAPSLPPARIADSGKVRMGAQAPSLPRK